MLKIDPIVKVDVNVGTTTASSGVFDVGAILGTNPVAGYFDGSHRFKEYASLAEMASDGFQTTSDEYIAASKYFGVSPAPSSVVMIYYFSNPAACDNAEEYSAEATYAVGDYCKRTVNEEVTRYICKQAIETAHAWSDADWDEVTTENEHPASAMLDAIDGGAEFYGVYYIAKPDEGQIDTYTAELVSAVESQNRGVVFYGVTGTVDSVIAADSLLNKMHQTGSKRAVGLYCTETVLDAAGLMGVAMGLSENNADSAFALCYKSVASATVNNITQPQVVSIKALNGNVYVQREKGRGFIENGATASGLRFDDQLYIDRMAYDIQHGVYNIIAGSAVKLPQTDSTTTVFINEIHTILDEYYDMGVLATSAWRGSSISGVIDTGDYVEHGHAEYADSFDTQSEADRALHKAMPITVLLCLSGSVESIVITVDVQT